MGTPCAAPSSTMVCASSRACTGDLMKAPEPTLTSSTSAPAPSASFLLIIELAINGSDSTVPVMSRSAYSLASAGASWPAAKIAAPTSQSCSRTRWLDRFAVNPVMDSSLSRVPPVWPSPRPDAWGTAPPQAATTGTNGSVILSPTPPVECLSTVASGRSVKSSRAPEASMAAVHLAISPRSMPRQTIAISSADICSSATRPSV
ncbi:Uncharacterised protein [Mycobacterium tuberculosis]|uniref:Uncharacterized protein n=1 Tax=Mycobacterium tuberculosis TaxID=1773 RepID=A0A654ZR23_MYCTX|nr:Uncharacterised protein [Mycobacterium tuberculosis]CKO66014.1 Uncharacterised protein [Mycobacterium tuberculosis]CKQ24542.1 Uncharacterised protein [Mycobacterium tuberculosis]SGO05401.1 Uncharacterised protein [Mycobacterium tuberculosis]